MMSKENKPEPEAVSKKEREKPRIDPEKIFMKP